MSASSPIDPERLVATLAGLGVAPGDSLLTHSSFRRLHRGADRATAPGYARALIRALKKHVGDDGALLMPTEFLADYQLDSFTGRLHDLRTAPTNRGFLCSTLLGVDGVARSSGPIYNVAGLGPRPFLSLFARHHECAFAMDVGSPWWAFMKRGGKVAYLGASLDSNSLIHMPEYVLKHDYPRPVFFSRPHRYRLIDQSGTERTVEAYVHAIRWGAAVVTRFMRHLDARYGLLREALIDDTLVVVVDAQAQYDALTAELDRGVSWYDAMTWDAAPSP